MPHLSPRELHERAAEDFATHTGCPPVIVRIHRSLSGDLLATAHNAPDSGAFYAAAFYTQSGHLRTMLGRNGKPHPPISDSGRILAAAVRPVTP